MRQDMTAMAISAMLWKGHWLPTRNVAEPAIRRKASCHFVLLCGKNIAAWS